MRRRLFQQANTKKGPLCQLAEGARVRHCLKRGRRPTLPHCIAVPSALAGLTSLFGMGRGGTPPQQPPGFSSERRVVFRAAVRPAWDKAAATQIRCARIAMHGIDEFESNHATRRGLPPEAFGQLVALGFGVAAFTPAPYQRRRLRRPSKELSSRGGLRA